MKRFILSLLILSTLLSLTIICNATLIADQLIDIPAEEEIMPTNSLYRYTDYNNIYRGKPYVPDGCIRTINDVRSVNSSYFISFVKATYDHFNSSSWKYHMETWEDDAGNKYECHYWQGPNNVTYYHL